MDEPREPFWDPNEPGIFDDPAVIAAADARAIADIEAGRVISNEAVIRWLTEIGKGNRPPPPQIGD
ncbi:CopG family transcriptional regulator [Sphingomonas qomolangmaensis]|uniref:CopG family transcriptional regulator n=1 Tax=Sphingomonas qomolangmaensis TaxID=2918765 RepID=A0ABY5LAB2_9SPHN|nr:CopG family transcriptional regulator [Sphingomonas qomolangmaensis]UUL82886.1 CopG family transcriptional regulator [Sphingomonas qomolangmaensis]